MSAILYSGFNRYELTRRGSTPADADVVPLRDRSSARRFLARFVANGSALRSLRRYYAVAQGRPISDLSDEQVLDGLAWQIASGRIVVIEGKTFWPSGGSAERPEPEEPELRGPPPADTKHWIRFKVIDDDTNEPIAGVTLRVRTPRGIERDYQTRADGSIQVDEINMGTCDIIAMVDEDGLEVVSVE